MTLHYHGTPIAPKSVLAELTGECFCVSFSDPRDLSRCLKIGQSVMLDNGAFSAWRRGLRVDWSGYREWLEPILFPPHWAVIPDVIDGAEDANDRLVTQWTADPYLSAPVWHMHERLDRLRRLCDAWPRVAVGSSGRYARLLTSSWCARMDAAWNAIHDRGTWVHMMRGMRLCDGWPWPFASLDSTDVARNHHRRRDAGRMARRWDSRQCPSRWEPREQIDMAFAARPAALGEGHGAEKT